MLSMHNIASASGGAEYYLKTAEYYQGDGEREKPQCQGKNIRDLVGNGELTVENFTRALNGELSNGKRLGKAQGNEIKHRPGVDLTFSAPKSLSILALIGGKSELADAHTRAVTETLKYAEKHLSFTRIGGKLSQVDNLNAIKFFQTTSRENDPQIHTHCVVLNAVFCKDGKWRCMETGAIYDSKMMLGQMYRLTLARILVSELGYELVVSKKDGTFEIKGVSKEINQLFSKRRDVIKGAAESMGVTSAVGMASITKGTRKKSENLTPEQLTNKCMQELKSAGLQLPDLKPDPNIEITQANKVKIARDAISASIKKLDTFMRFYTREEVIFNAMQQSFDKLVDPRELEKAFDKALKGNGLMSITQDKRLYISGETYKSEGNLRTIAQQSWETRHLYIGERLKHALFRFVIHNSSTVDTLSKALNAKQLVSIVDNFSPINDEKALGRLLQISKVFGKDAQIVSVGSVDRENLYSAGVNSSGLNKYLKSGAVLNGIVVVYGSEKLSMQQMERLLKSATLTNSKVVLLNAKDNATIDTRYSSVDLLAESGIQRVEMRTKAELTVSAINILKDIERVVEAKDWKDLAGQFISNEPRLIISANHVRLNETVRNALIESGKLGSKSVIVNNHTFKHMTDVELNRTVNYVSGDIVKVENLEILGGKPGKTKEGDHFKVISAENNVLLIEHGKNKKHYEVDMDKKTLSFGDISLYKARKMELRVGDRVILPKDNIYGERFKNQVGTVEMITDKAVSIGLGGEKKFELYHENGKNVFLERAWAVAAHRRVAGWTGGLDLHLSPESSKNVLKNLSNSKIAKISTIYTTDHKAIENTLSQMKSKIEFVTSTKRGLAVENTNGDKVGEITREKIQTREDRGRISENAAKTAIMKITEKEYSFTKEDVIREASAITVGALEIGEVIGGINKLMVEGDLIEVGKQNGISSFTTKDLSAKKDLALGKIETQISPICSKAEFDKKIIEIKSNIPHEHKRAVEGILTSSAGISFVQGFAGTAKTSLTLKNLSEIASLQGYEIKGFAPTHSACLELQAKAGIQARTVESAIQEIAKNKLHLSSNTVVIVDESSMLSIPDMVSLIGACSSKGAKLVLVGDQNQQPSVGAGEIYRELINSKEADVYHIKEILRQKTPAYKQGVQSLAMGNIETFFSVMKDSIVEVKGEGVGEATLSDVSHAVSREYSDINRTERDHAQIITLTNDARNEINNTVRDLLIEKGDLSVSSLDLKTYQAMDYSSSTKHYASTLSEGDVIRFNKEDERYSINAGEYLTIQKINDKDNTLLLSREGGELLNTRPDRTSLMSRGGIEVYRQENRSISVGEKIVFRRSIEDASVLNTDMGKITSLEGSLATVALKGRTIQLDLSKPENRHWDYGYAITSHLFQGKDCETVLCHFDTRSKPLANYQSFYVAVSRGEYSMKVFTDSVEGAQKAVTETYLAKNPAPIHEKQDLPTSRYEPKAPLLDRQERIALGQSAALICKGIMGEPLKTRGSTLYYGVKSGSLRVETAGDKAGLWNDFAAGEGGDIIDLIKYKTGNNFPDSVALARSITGDGPKARVDFSYAQPAPVVIDNSSRIDKAQSIFNSGIVVKGTPGEKYLHEHRKIPLNTIERSSSEIRYIPDFRFDGKSNRKFSAVAFAAKNAKGDINGVQVVLIDAKTGGKLPGQSKYSFGVMKGSSLCLGKQGGDIYIAEGPETALSIFAAKPDADVRACFSAENIKNAFIPLSASSAVICADNDGSGAPSEKAITKAVESIKGHGVSVSVAMPAEKGQDFNDVIKKGGVENVKNTLIEKTEIIALLPNDLTP